MVVRTATAGPTETWHLTNDPQKCQGLPAVIAVRALLPPKPGFSATSHVARCWRATDGPVSGELGDPRSCTRCARDSTGNSSAVKRYVLPCLKVVVPVAIIAWLLAKVPPEQYQQFATRPKNWPLLLGALAVVFTAVSMTFVRWYLLVRALRLHFRMVDAFRLGFLGYLFNFVVVGSVGGDLFKAIFIAREQPGRRAEAVATVLVDRLVGVYALVLLTSAVIVGGGIPKSTVEVETICHLTLAAAAVGAAGIAVLLIPGFTSGPLAEFLTGLPKIGHGAGPADQRRADLPHSDG